MTKETWSATMLLLACAFLMPGQSRFGMNTNCLFAMQGDSIEVEESEFDTMVNIEDLSQASTLAAQCSAMLAELQRLKSELNLENTTLIKIKDSLQKEIKSAARRIEESHPEMDHYAILSLDPALQQTVWDRAGEILDSTKQEKLANYIECCETLNEFYDLNGQAGVLLALDNVLCLSNHQIESLRELYSAVWYRLWNDQTNSMLFNRFSEGKEIVHSVRNELVREILTAEQYSVYESLTEYCFTSSQFHQADQWDLDEFKARCLALMNLKVMEVEQVCGLTQKQRLTLSVAAKGATDKLGNYWDKTAQAYFANKNSATVSNRLWDCLSTPILDQCLSQARWQRTITGVLEADQLEMLNLRKEQRMVFRKSYVVNSLARTFEQLMQHANSYDQHLALIELFEANLDVEETFNMSAFSPQMFKISDEEYLEIVPQSRWDRASEVWQQVKQLNELRDQRLTELESDDE